MDSILALLDQLDLAHARAARHLSIRGLASADLADARLIAARLRQAIERPTGEFAPLTPDGGGDD